MRPEDPLGQVEFLRNRRGEHSEHSDEEVLAPPARRKWGLLLGGVAVVAVLAGAGALAVAAVGSHPSDPVSGGTTAPAPAQTRQAVSPDRSAHAPRPERVPRRPAAPPRPPGPPPGLGPPAG